jgi:hypothetical protein
MDFDNAICPKSLNAPFAASATDDPKVRQVGKEVRLFARNRWHGLAGGNRSSIECAVGVHGRQDICEEILLEKVIHGISPLST